MPNRAARRAAMRKAMKANPVAAVAPVAEPSILEPSIPEPGAPFPSLEQISPRLAANRANAQLSQGPTTAEGKAASSQNRVSHGLARHNGHFRLAESEDASAFDKLVADLMAEHQPATETERILISSMAEAHWLAQRAQGLQYSCCDPVTGLVADPRSSALYFRYETTHRNNFHKSLNQLLKLRAERRKTEIGFEAQRVKTEAHQMKKDTHYWATLKSDAEVTHQIGLNIQQRLEAIAQNPAFEQLSAAELAKLGLQKGDFSVAQAA